MGLGFRVCGKGSRSAEPEFRKFHERHGFDLSPKLGLQEGGFVDYRTED